METRDYKIKQILPTRPNGSPSGNWVCGIDIGYSAVKVVSPNKNAIFPAFAEMDDSKTIGTPAPYSIIYKNLETGERWIVGESALNNISRVIHHIQTIHCMDVNVMMIRCSWY